MTGGSAVTRPHGDGEGRRGATRGSAVTDTLRVAGIGMGRTGGSVSGSSDKPVALAASTSPGSEAPRRGSEAPRKKWGTIGGGGVESLISLNL